MRDGFSFTPEQDAAIGHRGDALLVSAAAGSGKTKVLVERLLSRIEDGDDIDEFLVITYTRAAAAELREKIYDEILGRLADEPENRRLRRQSMLCRGAPIDTIHGFCTDILRENAHHAELPPDFRVTDESESDMIKADVLDNVLNDAYESIGASEGFYALIDTISAGRDDKRLVRIILDTHAKLQSNPDPSAWVEKQAQLLSLIDVSDVSETVWGAQLMKKTRRTILFWFNEMSRVRNTMQASPDFEKAYGASFDATITDIETFLAALDNGWDEARRYSDINFSRVKPKPVSGYDDFKDIRLRCKAAMKKCASIFECGSQEHMDDIKAAAPAMTALFQLVLEFDHEYSIEKRRRGVVDFSDLEHIALSLLIDIKTGNKTGLARAISKRFKEIMVDEYQDVNAVQEYIFNAVTQDSKNIFMVGDVKQSIYRFRLADPSIFLGKYRKFTAYGSNSEFGIRNSELRGGGNSEFRDGSCDSGTKVLLSRNFRSCAGILEAVNFVFSNIMSIEFGEMDYTEAEQLIPGRETDGIPNSESSEPIVPAVELDVIDMSVLQQDEDEESPVRAQVEAKFIAERIEQLTNGEYFIPDGQGGMRRIEYSDIVILLRSIRNKAWQYSVALNQRGIPADMPGGEGFFETVEIYTALSLLSVIDNPMQDIPLAAALRSPVYGFTDDELAMIRAGARGVDFYRALIKAAETNEKCAAFLAELDALREVAPDMPADRFIWHMYNKTGLPGRVGAARGGDRRRNNLILLAEYAHGFEQSGYKGLFGFLTYIRGLQERGAEIARGAAEPSANTIDAVRIMSIHKSKGLEFPVVILADTSKSINNMDAQQPLVLHPELGAGPMRIDRQRRIEYTTLARMAIQSKLTSETMAEELRLLYVAMTRAREKLIITATYKDAGKEIEKLSKLASGGVVPQVLEEIKNMAGWVLLPVLNGTWKVESGKIVWGREQGIMDIRLVSAAGENSDFEIRNTEQKDTASVNKLVPEALPEHVELLHNRFNFKYPHALAPELPSKLTVTGLKGRHIDQEAAILHPEMSKAIVSSEFRIPNTELPQEVGQPPDLQRTAKEKSPAFARPSFIAKKAGLTTTERGTALHLAMQYIDFAKCSETNGIGEELKRLATKRLLTEEQVHAVNVKKISRFFKSDIGKRVLSAGYIKREFKFSLLYPAEKFYLGGGDDEILLQGVVDCLFEEGGALVIVDYKTDYVTPDTLEEKVNLYAPQLAAYSDAMERITGKCVKDRIIYFFALDRGVSMPAHLDSGCSEANSELMNSHVEFS